MEGGDRNIERAPAVYSQLTHDQAKTRRLRTVVASPRVSADDPRDPHIGPRFMIGDELGRGGMGRVVAAVDTLLGRDVAIKQVLGDADRARFEREARITAQLEHPSIVPVHDVGEDDCGQPYYVMRRIAGEPLADRIAAASDTPARLRLVARLVTAVDAAGFAHARGIVHRDIKPGNILLGAHGETLLIDWGLARTLDEPDELAGLPVGTAGYMAPEQARGEAADARSDVYALGATLFEILGGSIGHGLSSPTQWIERAAVGERPDLARFDREVPRELVAIAARALAADPGERYADGRELAGDLRAFLDGRLVAAYRYSRTERLARFVRRHRVAVVIGGCALAAIAATAIVAVTRVVDQRERARAARRDADDRTEVMLLDRASSIAERDPTRAVALLTQLPLGSPHTARARDIAAIAALHGVSHGDASHTGLIVALAIGPDGHTLLSASKGDDTIRLRDLATGATRTIADVPVELAAWADGGATIAYTTRAHELRTIDVASGSDRVLETGIDIDALWAPGDGARLRFLAGQRIVERDGAERRELAHDVVAYAEVGAQLVVAGAGTIRLAGDRVVAHYTGADPATLALSSDATYVAAGFRDTAIEWVTATGAVRAAWPDAGRIVRYDGDRLYAANASRGYQLDRLLPSGTREAIAGDWSMIWSTRAGSHLAIANAHGDVGVLGDDGIRELHLEHAGTRMIAGRADSPYLAIGSSEGTIRWWDLRQVLPASYAIPGDRLCGIDAAHIYVRTIDALAIVARRDGAVRTVAVPGMDCLVGSFDGRIVALEPHGFSVVDAAHATARHYAGSPMLSTRGIFVASGKTIYDITSGEPIARFTAARPLRGATMTDDAFGLELDDGTLIRVDSTGAAVFAPRAAPTLFALGPDHNWCYADGDQLFGDDHAAGSLPTRAQAVWFTPTGRCIALGVDHALWRVDPVERVTAPIVGQAFTHGRRVAAALDGGIARVTFLETGEQLALGAPDATMLSLFERDRWLAIVRRERLDLYIDPVPGDPIAFAAWLATATNAVVTPGSDAEEWR